MELTKLNFKDINSVYNFLEDECGCSLEEIKITDQYPFIEIKVNGKVIAEAVNEAELKSQVLKYYQDCAIEMFLPDLISDLKMSNSNGKLCVLTLKALHRMSKNLIESYNLTNKDFKS